MNGVIKGVALFSQHQAAGVAMKQRDAQISFKAAHLPRNCRLAEVEPVGGMGKAAGAGYRMKNAQFVPIHWHCRGLASSLFGSLIYRFQFFFFCEVFFRFKGRHATQAGGRYGLAKNIVGNITGGKDTRNFGRR